MSDRPDPIPLPLDAFKGPPDTARKRRRSALAVTAIVLSVLVLSGVACVGTLSLIGSTADSWAPKLLDTVGPRMTTARPSVHVAGERYIIAQSVSYERNGSRQSMHAAVVAYDLETASTVELVDHRLVGVEKAAPVAWVVPDTPRSLSELSEGGTTSFADQAGDAIARRDHGICLWDPSTNTTSAPLPPREPMWAPWVGPSGRTVMIGVDPDVITAPRRLTFVEADGSPGAICWASPIRIGFEPIGWSPSGRYFAVMKTDPDTYRIPCTERHIALRSSTNELQIIDTETAKIVAESGVGMANQTNLRESACWDAETDVLYIAVGTVRDLAEGGPRDSHLYVLDPVDVEQSAPIPIKEYWNDPPVELSGSAWRLIGTAADGAYAASHDGDRERIWRLTRDGAENLGLLDAYRPYMLTMLNDGRIVSLSTPPPDGAASLIVGNMTLHRVEAQRPGEAPSVLFESSLRATGTGTGPDTE